MRRGDQVAKLIIRRGFARRRLTQRCGQRVDLFLAEISTKQRASLREQLIDLCLHRRIARREALFALLDAASKIVLRI